MSADKYPSIFSHQMVTIVCLDQDLVDQRTGMQHSYPHSPDKSLSSCEQHDYHLALYPVNQVIVTQPLNNRPSWAKLVRQSQIVQSVMQDCQYDLSHLLPACNLLVQGPKITYNHCLSRRSGLLW